MKLQIEQAHKDTMVKVLRLYQGLTSSEKKLVKHSVGVIEEDVGEQVGKLLEILSYRPQDYKKIFKDLIMHDAKLSNREDKDSSGDPMSGDSEEGEAQE